MTFCVQETEIPGVLLIEPEVFGDDRGFFFESFNLREFGLTTGVEVSFVQDNHSGSSKGVLRGLHYQLGRPQGKLIRVVEGVIFDVAVDIRLNSTSFAKWTAAELSATNKRQLWIPPGFAHGFYVTSESAQVIYKTTDYYDQKQERSIRWNDPDIGIAWPEMSTPPVLSSKDADASWLEEAELPQT